MNTKTTVMLLILLILCVGYVLVFHGGLFGRGGSLTETAEDADNRLFRGVGRIERLSLERPGAEKIVLVRREGTWRLAEPVDAPASEWKVDAVIAAAVSLQYVHKYAADDDQCPRDDLTHLSAPLKVVTFTDENGDSHTIKVGQKVPLEKDRTYVQLAGDDHVYVVEADLNATLSADLDEYRKKDVARFDVKKALRIRIRGDREYRLAKLDPPDGRWTIDKPISARADQDKVQSILRSISNIYVEKFVDDDPKDLAAYGLKNPRLQVTVDILSGTQPTSSKPASRPATEPATAPIEARKTKVVSIAFGLTSGEAVFAKLTDEPWVFQVPESRLKDLEIMLSKIRDRRVLECPDNQVTRIELSLPAGSATLEKVGPTWRMRRPFEGPCDEDAVNGLISTLRDLRADDFEDNPTAPAAFGLEPPTGKITLHFQGIETTAALSLGRSSDSGQMGFVQQAGGDSVAIVSSADFATLLRPSPAYWNRTIFELPDADDVLSVDLDRPDGKFTVVASGKNRFELTAPVRAEADEENVKTMIEALKNVRAEKIVVLNKTLPKRFAQDKGAIRVVLVHRATTPASQPAATQASSPAPQPGPKTVAMIVTKEKGRSYVRLSGAQPDGNVPIVLGELGGQFYDKLAAEFRDRTVLEIDTAAVVSLKMDLGDVSMEFVRSGGLWRYTGDRFVSVNAGKIGGFMAGLSHMKAERFVDYGPKPDLKRFGLDAPAMTLTVKTDGGRRISLSIARAGPVGTKGLYAVSSQVPGVFVLGAEAPEKMRESLEGLRKTETVPD